MRTGLLITIVGKITAELFSQLDNGLLAALVQPAHPAVQHQPRTQLHVLARLLIQAGKQFAHRTAIDRLVSEGVTQGRLAHKGFIAADLGPFVQTACAQQKCYFRLGQ
jgi:hypothetical protein